MTSATKMVKRICERRARSEATSGRLLVIVVGDMCEERSDELIFLMGDILLLRSSLRSSPHLSLSGVGDSVPSIKRLHGGEGLESGSVGELTREVESSTLDDVSGGGKHGNTSMLELSSAEPKESLCAKRRVEDC